MAGVRVPSVTHTISESLPFPAGISREVLERAANFGIACHKTLELLDRGVKITYDPLLEPYVKAWEAFKADHLLKLQGRLIVDIKTGAFSPSWYVQLAAYWKMVERERLLETQGVLIEKRVYSKDFCGMVDRVYINGSGRKTVLLAVRLADTGQYHLHVSPNSPATDFNYFQSMLNVWKWKHTNKKLLEQFKNDYCD